jgi:peptidase E
MAELLLLSKSTAPGRRFLEHALGAVTEVMHGRRRLLFVALASGDPDGYSQLMRDCLARIGIRVECVDAAGLRGAVAGPMTAPDISQFELVDPAPAAS